jgi:8-oxo-dGTP pyrophosphatase MutT (NUDIX family)
VVNSHLLYRLSYLGSRTASPQSLAPTPVVGGLIANATGVCKPLFHIFLFFRSMREAIEEKSAFHDESTPLYKPPHALPPTHASASASDAGTPAPADNPWRILARQVVYDNPWIGVVHHDVRTPGDTAGVYGVVHFKNHAVGVIPVAENGDTWLVGQFRFPLNRYSWEIPEGGCPLGEAPQAAAARELREETGLMARHMLPLHHLASSNSVCDEQGTIFVAWDLWQGVAAPDETERLALRRLSLRAALDMALSGAIDDAISLIALLRMPLLAHASDTPPDLRRAISNGLG